jgi:hypothetical protein
MGLFTRSSLKCALLGRPWGEITWKMFEPVGVTCSSPSSHGTHIWCVFLSARSFEEFYDPIQMNCPTNRYSVPKSYPYPHRKTRPAQQENKEQLSQFRNVKMKQRHPLQAIANHV